MTASYQLAPDLHKSVLLEEKLRPILHVCFLFSAPELSHSISCMVSI